MERRGKEGGDGWKKRGWGRILLKIKHANLSKKGHFFPRWMNLVIFADCTVRNYVLNKLKNIDVYMVKLCSEYTFSYIK